MQRATPYPRPRIPRGRLYDVVATLTRVGVGGMFAEYGLALRGREAAVADQLSASGVPAATLGALVLPAVLVSLSLAFAVGLLTWFTGPALAVAAVLGTLTAGSPHLAPFSSWATTALVTAVCVLMAVSAGRWSWDYLVLAPRLPDRPRPPDRKPPVTPRKAAADSARRPEHAPPLLYPVGQAALRRPYRL